MESSDPPATERITSDLARLIFESHDGCVSCGYSFRRGDIAYCGYGEKGIPLYVCSTCARTELTEVARRTYYMERPYKVPEPTAALWRYMDFTKYASLLSTKTLYFPNAACLDDAFEGAKGLAENKHKWDAHYLDFFRGAIRSAPKAEGPEIGEEAIEANAQRLLRDIETIGIRDRERTFICCWHESQYESEAMWRLYSTSMNHAVAIQTTVGAAYAALGKDPRIAIGRLASGKGPK